jgi:hypothetical protein
MVKHLWEATRDSTVNFGIARVNFAKDAIYYKCWDDFFDAEANSIDFLIMWDWEAPLDKKSDNFKWRKDENYRDCKLHLFWMINNKRKGYKYSVIEVCRSDEEKVNNWLKNRYENLKKVWEPISG